MPAKKTASKAKKSRFAKLGKIFNVSSTKGKLAVFLLSFAVIGGGFAAYRSFAATSANGPSQPTDASYYCPSPHPTISQAKGSTGGCVKYAQWILLLASQAVGLSGTFDANTTTAVKNIQRAQGLTADGIIGPKTWEKLDSSVRRGNTLSKRNGLAAACMDANLYSGATLVTAPKVGPTYTLRIIAKNTGTVTWPAPDFYTYPYLNGSNNDGLSGYSVVNYFNTTRNTTPGQTYVFIRNLKFTKAGAYYFQNTLLEDSGNQDSSYFFGPRCDLRIVVG